MSIHCTQILSSIFPILKDIAIIILSASALFSGFLFNRRSRKDKWVDDFRKHLVYALALFSKGSKTKEIYFWNISPAQFSPEQREYLLQLEQAALSVILFLNDKKEKQNVLINKMVDIINMANNHDFSNTTAHLNDILELSKTIIREELSENWCDFNTKSSTNS